MYLTRKVNVTTEEMPWGTWSITQTLYNTFSITIKIPFLMLLMNGFMFHSVSTSDTEKKKKKPKRPGRNC